MYPYKISLSIDDLVGRLTREESALGNVTTFGYDESGNMTALTPPGRPAHTFSYTPIDLESEYAPPVLADVSMPETTYDYSLDRELELETRPDGRVIDWQYDAAGRLSKLAFPAEGESGTSTGRPRNPVMLPESIG